MEVVVTGRVQRTSELRVEVDLSPRKIEVYQALRSDQERARFLDRVVREAAEFDWFEAELLDEYVFDVQAEIILHEDDEDYVPPVQIHPDQGKLV